MSHDPLVDPPRCRCGHSRYKHYVTSVKWDKGHYEAVPPQYGKCKSAKCLCWKYTIPQQKGQVTR